MLADLPTMYKAVALEHFHRGVVEERARDLPPGGVLRIARYEAASKPSDLVQHPGESGACHPAVPIRATDKKACDSPVGSLVQGGIVGLLVFDSREFSNRSKLPPPNTCCSAIDERSVRPALAHPRFFECSSRLGTMYTRCALLVEVEAPAPIPHPVVCFRQAGKIKPCLSRERFRSELHVSNIRKVHHDRLDPDGSAWEGYYSRMAAASSTWCG